MANETGDTGEGLGEGQSTAEEEDYVDIDEELEKAESQGGALSDVSQKLRNFFRADNESDKWSKKSINGSKVSRRGVIAGTAGVLAGGYGLAEATDGDGWDVDWNSRNGGEGPAGGVAPPPGEDDGAQTGAGVEDSNHYAWDTEQELMDQTDFCYPGEANAYLGAIDANEVEQKLSESSYNGEDPTGALSFEEIEMTLEDITPHQGLYAVDVDRKQGNNGDYDIFVQLVGKEDGGLYLTREGTKEVDEMEFEEVFEGYHDCS